jgi:hypothetical protein
MDGIGQNGKCGWNDQPDQNEEYFPVPGSFGWKNDLVHVLSFLFRDQVEILFFQGILFHSINA